MADFIEANPWEDVVFPKFAGRNFNVDVVNGDFYDIKAFTQKNWIQDNDVVVQNEHTAFYQVDAGLNQQLNVAALAQEFAKYDVIIVGGDYHSANLIYQTNIVLDDDFVMLSVDGDGEGGDYTILAGQNWLLNSATLQDLGVDETSPVSENLVKLCDAIAARQEQFDPTLAHELTGNGSGTLNVLYVSGDYYDLSLLYQINVILDADTAVQYLPAGAQDAEDFVQYASTGNNAAANQAELISVGVVEELFVAGDHYEDELLVQTNIIVPEGEEVTTNDPSSVPPELAVFVADQTTPATNTGTSDVPVGPDPVASQQDMLGGVMA